jgi:hypothetical protein
VLLGCIVLALLLIFALVFSEWTTIRDEPQIRSSHLLLEDGTRRDITLPFFQKSPVPHAVYEYAVAIEWHKGAAARFRIIPDDYLESIIVNGQLLPGERYPEPGRSDYTFGLVVDFSSYLHDGVNELLFRITDTGGAYGMNLKVIELAYSPLRIAAFTICILLVLAIVFLILRYFKNVDWVIIIFVMTALVWQLISLAVRAYYEFGFDLHYGAGIGHIEYIQYIAEKGSLPSPQGWISYHPPLYYITAAGVWILAKALHLTDPFKALQILSLAYYWIFLVFSLRLLKQAIKQPWFYRIAAALLIFWPQGFLAATRIGNDVLLFPLFVMTLFYGQRWLSGGKNRDLLLASIFCGLGLFTKISIFPLGVLLGCIILWRLLRKHTTLSLWYAIAAIFILAGSFFLSGLNKWVYTIKTHNPQWLTSPFHNHWNVRLNSGLYVDNYTMDFVFPDTKSWFEDVPPDVWRDGARKRSNFWNHVLKTLMHGQIAYKNNLRPKLLMPYMNILFVFLVVLACYGFPLFWRRRLIPYMPFSAGSSALVSRRKNTGQKRLRRIGRCFGQARTHSKETDLRFVLAGSALLLIFCMIARILKPTPTINDARYLMPIIPAVVLAIAYGLARLQDRRWLYISANAVVLCFILLSLIFYFALPGYL